MPNKALSSLLPQAAAAAAAPKPRRPQASKLPAKYNVRIKTLHLDGYTPTEIAAALGVDRNAVKRVIGK